jgi:penicillin-binding protein 1A
MATNDPQGPRRRRSEGTFTTKSGNNIKLNRSFSGRRAAKKDAVARKRAAYLSTLPKNRWKRLAYRLEPKRVFHYWFSREGGIMALKILGVGIVVCFLLLVGLFAYFRKDLPNITDVSGNNLPGSISYYDRTGKTLLWQDYDAVKRIPVQSDNISPYMKEATVAIEDKDFYHEGAFNVRGISRAAFDDLFHRSSGLQGGSTITQQLVKLNENWTDNRTITRKVKELILAVELSREYSKEDILTGYLNAAPYGGVEYGCESAARDYFHSTCAKLTLAQASMLASIPQYPSAYSPYSDPKYNPSASSSYFDQDGLLGRQSYVLDRMVQQGMIDQADANAAKKVDVLAQVHELTPKYQGIKAPYFVLAARQELEDKFGSQTYQRGGWQVTTTLNTGLQAESEKLVANNFSNIQYLTGGAADEEALVSEDVQTGQIVSLVGGVDFNNQAYGQNNYAAGVLIPPGSSFKPYDYTTLIENNNAGAGSVLYDSESPLPGYACTNHTPPPPRGQGNCLTDYDFYQPGPITLRYALGGSRNIPAVKAMLSAVASPNASANPGVLTNNEVSSVNKTIATASAMMDNGNKTTYNCYSDEALTKTTQCYGASAIGDGAFLHLDDHVNGLSTLARLGNAIPRTYILKITDATGKSIYAWQQPKGNQVIHKDTAYIIDNMASDPNASYLPGYCSATTCSPNGYKFQRFNGWNFAVKTGTTNNGFDGLMTSWSAKYAVVAWVGNHQRNVDLTAARGTAMEYLTEPLVKGFMEYAHTGLAPINWQQPTGVKRAPAFVVTRHIHYGDVEPSPSTDLFPSWYNPPNSGNTSVVIDKVSGKVATNCTPADAKQFVTNGNANSFSVDQFVPGGRSSSQYNSTTTDDVHNCDDTQPSANMTVSSNDDGVNNGGGGGQVVCDQAGCNITVTATQGTHPLGSANFPGNITISVNDKAVKTCTLGANTSSPSPPCTYTYTPSSNGSVTVSATVTDSVLYKAEADGSPVTLQSIKGGGNGNGNGGGGNQGGFVPPVPGRFRPFI